MNHVVQNANSIARETRTEVYLGVIAPVGIRREPFLAALKRVLKPFRYQVEMVRLSDLLRDFQDTHVDLSAEDARLTTAMEAGSRLRERLGPDVLARAALAEVSGRRGKPAIPETAYVFWSLKHPEEAATLRLMYGGSFHLIGLFASEEDRIQELMNRDEVDEEAAIRHVARDREEVASEGSRRPRGQRTRDTFHREDVFLEWHREPAEKAPSALRRDPLRAPGRDADC